MSCPNRDGTLGRGGCIFCSQGGSGEFSQPRRDSVASQIEAAKERVSRKIKGGRFIAYFQSYTNTYAPVHYLEALFTEALSHPDVAALSIGTRPDCLPPEVIGLLKKLNRQKPVWVELGLQSIHEETAAFIHRGYPFSCFLESYSQLKKAGLPVIVHVILGLPCETRRMMLETVDCLGQMHVDGIKLQLLHVLGGTQLAALYEKEPFPIFALEQYVQLVADCISLLPPDVVIHRISGDGPQKLLIAPLWSGNKRLVLNSISKYLKEQGIYQGMTFPASSRVTPKEI